jgi:hypothetical protein
MLLQFPRPACLLRQLVDHPRAGGLPRRLAAPLPMGARRPCLRADGPSSWRWGSSGEDIEAMYVHLAHLPGVRYAGTGGSRRWDALYSWLVFDSTNASSVEPTTCGVRYSRRKPLPATSFLRLVPRPHRKSLGCRRFDREPLRRTLVVSPSSH